MTCWPHSCVSLSASTRVHTSGLEPGPTEVTILTGPDGKLCARALFAVKASAALPARNDRRPIRRRIFGDVIAFSRLRRTKLHDLQRRAAEQAVRMVDRFHDLEVVVAFHHRQRDRLAGCLHRGVEVAALALELQRL